MKTEQKKTRVKCPCCHKVMEIEIPKGRHVAVVELESCKDPQKACPEKVTPAPVCPRCTAELYVGLKPPQRKVSPAGKKNAA